MASSGEKGEASRADKEDTRKNARKVHRELIEGIHKRQQDWIEQEARRGFQFLLKFLGISLLLCSLVLLLRIAPWRRPVQVIIAVLCIGWMIGGVYLFISGALKVNAVHGSEQALLPRRYNAFIQEVKEKVQEGENVLLVIRDPKKFHEAFTKRVPAFIQLAANALYPRRLFFERKHPTANRFSWKRAGKKGMHWVLFVSDLENFECVRVKGSTDSAFRKAGPSKGNPDLR